MKVLGHKMLLVATCLAATSAHAMTIPQLAVRTVLHQPLYAAGDVIPDDWESFDYVRTHVRVATPQQYKMFGIRRPEFLDGASVTVRNAAGEWLLEVQGDKPVIAVRFDLILQLDDKLVNFPVIMSAVRQINIAPASILGSNDLQSVAQMDMEFKRLREARNATFPSLAASRPRAGTPRQTKSLSPSLLREGLAPARPVFSRTPTHESPLALGFIAARWAALETTLTTNAASAWNEKAVSHVVVRALGTSRSQAGPKPTVSPVRVLVDKPTAAGKTADDDKQQPQKTNRRPVAATENKSIKMVRHIGIALADSKAQDKKPIYIVKHGDSLRLIAARIKTTKPLTLDQKVLLLYLNNARVFPGHNMNNLPAGAKLNVSIHEDDAPLPAKASKIVDEHYKKWKRAKANKRTIQPATAKGEKA